MITSSIRSQPIDDMLVEGDETVIARLVAPDATVPPAYLVDLLHASATVIIQDNEPGLVPVVSLSATRAETREPFCDPALCDAPTPAPGVFQLSRRGGNLTRELSVVIQYAGTAINGTDYDPLADFVTFPAGQASVEVLVSATFDQLAEGDEVVAAELQPDPSVGPIERYRVDPTQAAARIVIHDNTPPAPRPIVRIEATSPIAEETSAPLRRLAMRGEFTISRDGSTSNALSVFVHYSGTATPGADYPALPFLITIPAGAASLSLEVVPIEDKLGEGLETVVAQLSHCPPDTDPALGIRCVDGFDIDPAHDRATVLIRDDGVTEASLTLTAPQEGDTFAEGATIPVQATAVDLEGAITKVEFYDGDIKIGESELFFFVEPPPGTPIFHEFVWTGAAVGAHTLTARATDAAGQPVQSLAVSILVTEKPSDVPIVTVTPRDGFAVEPIDGSELDVAAFRLHRTSPTNADLTVAYSLQGSAGNGVDYERLSGLAIVPRGRRSVLVTVTPIEDGLRERVETVVLQVEGPPTDQVPPPYRVGTPARAVVLISDQPWVHAADAAACVQLPEGFVHVCFGAEPPSGYRVEASSNLLDWEAIYHGTPTDGALHYVDEDAARFPRRFYRLVPEAPQPED